MLTARRQRLLPSAGLQNPAGLPQPAPQPARPPLRLPAAVVPGRDRVGRQD